MSSRHLGILIVTAETSTSLLVPLERVQRRPLSIGAHADIAVDGAGLAGEHLYVRVHDGHLLVTAAETSITPLVVVDGATREVTPSVWLAVDVRSHVRVGDAVVRFSWCEPLSVGVAHPRAEPPPSPAAGRTKLPPVSPPPRRSPSLPSCSPGAIEADLTRVVSLDAPTVRAEVAHVDDRPTSELRAPGPPSAPTRIAPLTRAAATPLRHTSVTPLCIAPPALASPAQGAAGRGVSWWPSQGELFALVRRAVAALSRLVDALEERARRPRSPSRALRAK